MVDIGYRVPRAANGYGSDEDVNIPVPVLSPLMAVSNMQK